MRKLGFALLAFLVVSAIYLYAWPAPNLVYPAVVLAHAGFGVLVTLLGLRYIPKLRTSGLLAGSAGALMGVGAVIGIVLIFIGTSRPQRYALWAHIAFCVVAVVLLATWLVRQRRANSGVSSGTPWGAFAGIVALVAVVSVAAWYARGFWSKQYAIKNPNAAPLTMDDEGDGSTGMFFPSSAQVAGKRKIPAKFFMESDACARCHQDIYNQWQKSAHHFSSFNNQWYRKSIEYMQDVRGTKPSKWCGGCHDPAVLYSGLMDTPIKQIIHRPESQAGLGCMMCHSIVKVKSTMGQADFMLEYPELHELAATKNPVMRALHDFTIKLNPEPHRRVFLKPFMKEQTAEFCSSCHKVHLDAPVNNYRWIRGFNEYDNWQASGVSGFGARSFYYPPKSQQCADCHMPAAKSNDFGNIDGFVHSHQFPGANTALPTANEDPAQLKLIENFLKTAVTVDIFAISHAATPVGGTAQAENSTSFAVGEEAEVKTTGENTTESVPVTAPLDETNPVLRRGESVRMDVVVRTRKVGHFFPGGTVDAFDTWLELKAVDDKGQPVFWSGKVEDDGKGPVEKGAHFYRSLQIDEHGNEINKRNAWSTRSTVYVRLIPPGAADTVHFRVNVPENVGDKIKFTARLCYRKFSWYNTHFAYAGQSKDRVAEPLTKASYDDRGFTFDGDLADVSGKMKSVPDLPIEVLAEKTVELRVVPKNTPLETPKTVTKKDEWQRWNDYGIGLLLQGDLKGAAAAFVKVTEADPNNPDGWVNLGRVAVQEGDMERAREVLTKALKINANLARARFFYARVLRSDGNYDGAAQELQAVLAQYPKDRVVRNDLGRIYFLQRKYDQAIAELQQVMEVDPEDLQANYNLMLCYRGLGKTEVAADYEKRYLRFKADEASQAISGEYRRKHPEDNNERQQIHEHVSVPLGPTSKSVTPVKTAKTTQTHGASAGK
ncbi:Tetratricopeptide repeat protein [Candidatus Koribacter versatilis Ellin345]|uniref:Tetratricopeptide repeat protein n=1 Tax=Koribacter versatilis (strain Ellin345) TaxID=204669 RepID=Q1IR16_KORVE|nr:tetratricopeptide repeat protein [Candidatus Koribacter versatilis]ABF40684.1 Tetratricopeptide repeat protein [Candidatus Koribacter versatilis Ellin345]